MKTARKIIALVLTAAMAISLTGCGLFDTKMARAIQKMSKLESLHVDLSATAVLDLTLTQTAEEEPEPANTAAGENIGDAAPDPVDAAPAITAIPLEGAVQCGIDWFTQPLLAKVDVDLSLPGTTDHYLAYLIKEDAAIYLYSLRNEGSMWQKSGFAESDDERASGVKYIIQGAESFDQTGEELLDGVQTTRYDGLLSGDYLEGLIRLYKIRELLADEMGMQLEDDVFENMGDVPATFWLDDSAGMVVRLDVDLTEAADRIGEKQLRRLREASGIEALGLDLKLKSFVVSAKLSRFNEIETFTVPDEARAAWGEDTKMPWET